MNKEHIRNIVLEIMKYNWEGVNKHEVNGIIDSFVDKILEGLK